jgi:secreted trypsin-like serine protease
MFIRGIFTLILGIFIATESSAQSTGSTHGSKFTVQQLKELNANVAKQLTTTTPRAQASKAITSAESLLIARIDPRIIGGDYTTIEKNPWQVALVLGFAPEPIRQQFCGGSLIAANWVLTAAHCVDNQSSPERVDVITGTTFYKSFGQRIKSDRIYIHSGWNSNTMENDIALIRLSMPASMGAPVALPVAENGIPSASTISVTGWGAIFEGGGSSEVLMGAEIPIVERDQCNEPLAYNGRIKLSMFCAGFRDGGLDSCQGDSGGPASAIQNGKPTLLGVVSWGEGCARKMKYGVYTRVSAFRDWIDKTIAIN